MRRLKRTSVATVAPPLVHSKHYNSFPFFPIWVDPLCPDSVVWPGSRRAPRKLSLVFRFLLRGSRKLFYLPLFFYLLISFSLSAAIFNPSVGTGLWWCQRMLAMCHPSLFGKPILGGRRSNPLLPLCQIFWGIPQRRRARSPKDTQLFQSGVGFQLLLDFHPAF